MKDIVVNKTTSYKFNEDYKCWIDWEQFLEIYNNLDNNVTIKRLKQAVELYKGDLFPALRYENWIEDTRTNLKEKYLDILYKLSEKLYEENKHVESLMYLNKGMEDETYREDYYNLMMKNLAQTGRIYDAISLFEDYRKLIKVELGIDPGASITKTYHKIKNSKLVQQHISNQSDSKGALLCDIDVFNQIYELEKRQITRTDKIFTLLTMDFSEVNIEDQKIENILEEMAVLFRTGDVACCHNKAINIILHDMNLEKG
jgi:pentatricopeptide repeat protein